MRDSYWIWHDKFAMYLYIVLAMQYLNIASTESSAQRYVSLYWFSFDKSLHYKIEQKICKHIYEVTSIAIRSDFMHVKVVVVLSFPFSKIYSLSISRVIFYDQIRKHLIMVNTAMTVSIDLSGATVNLFWLRLYYVPKCI